MYTKKLKAVLERARQGEEVTIGFLGGSITQGCNPSIPENAYVERLDKWFRENFSNAKINKINVGVGATGSLIGVHRVERDLLVHKPDLIFIDFAANDVPPKIKTHLSYESLVRRIMATLEETAIVEIFMTLEDGTSAEAEEAAIAKHYGIPTVSFRQEIFNAIQKGTYTWQDIETDEVHPNDRGHGIISELVIKLLEEVLADDNKNEAVEQGVQEVLYGAPYEKGKLLTIKELKPSKMQGFVEGNERFRTIEGGYCTLENMEEAELVFEVEGSNLFLLYVKGIETYRGEVGIQVDELPKMTLSTFFDKGWGNYPETYPILEGATYKKHKITLTVLKEDSKYLVSILGVLVS